MIDWSTSSREKFERLADALIFRAVDAVNPTWVTDAIEGRGGDGGRDIDVRESRGGRIIRIYQLKHFRDGFSGGTKTTRQAQIRRSFKAAQAHDPDEWVLVVPCKLAPGERTFVEGLGTKARTTVNILDATRLDDLCARYPDLEKSAEMDQYREALTLVSRESAALNKPGDLGEEVRLLKGRVDARSPYWTQEIETRGGQIIQTLVAQRADAAEKEPLGFTMTTRFEKSDPLRVELKDALNYGLFEPLTLSSHVITQFEQHGPEWFEEIMQGVEVVLGPLEEDALTVEHALTMVLLDAEGATTRRAKAVEARSTSGQLGRKLRLKFVGGVEFELKHPFNPDESDGQGAARLRAKFVGLNASEASRGVDLVNALAVAAGFRIEADGTPVIGALSRDGADNNRSVDPVWEEAIRDLSRVQELSNADLTVVSEMTRPEERRQLRIARIILEGRVTVLPGNLTLDLGNVEDRDNDSLAALVRGEGQLFLQRPQEEMRFLGQTIPMGDVMYRLGEVVVEDPAEVLKNIEKDPTGAWEAKARPKRPERGTIVYSLSRYLNDQNGGPSFTASRATKAKTFCSPNLGVSLTSQNMPGSGNSSKPRTHPGNRAEPRTRPRGRPRGRSCSGIVRPHTWVGRGRPCHRQGGQLGRIRVKACSFTLVRAGETARSARTWCSFSAHLLA